MILCDTNVLLHAVQRDDPRFSAAVNCIEWTLGNREPVVVFLQNLVEFWNVATRPAKFNGLGCSVSRAYSELAYLRRSVELLQDHPKTATIWQALVVDYQVRGAQVHDARLVAGMKAYGIRQVFTYNAADFTRYPEIEALDPGEI